MRAFFTSSLSVKVYNFESHEIVFPKLVHSQQDLAGEENKVQESKDDGLIVVNYIPESLRVLPDGNNNAIGITSTSPRAEDLCFQSPEMSSDLHLLKVQSNPRDDHHVGKMGLSESYNLYDHYRAFVWS